MTFEIKECTLGDVAPHATIRGRTKGNVKVRLQETQPGSTFDHNLTLRVWADVVDGASASEIRTQLLAKAAHILNRTVAVAERVALPPRRPT